jgi:hypothetical protein
MSFAELIDIEKDIEMGRMDAATRRLAHLSFDKISDKRFQNHLIGKILFFRANYEQAIKVYISACNDFGPHVRLLCDLVGAFLLLGNFKEAEVWLEKLEQELDLCKEILNSENLSRVYIYLVKVNEEFCRFDKCYALLETLKNIKSQTHYWKHLALVSELRLHAHLGNKSYLPVLYREVSLLNHDRIRFQMEKEHALCLAEAQLFGISKINLRVERYLAEVQIPDDKILMLTELVDWCLNEDHKIPLLFECFLKLDPQDAFEKALQILVHASIKKNIYDSNICGQVLSLIDHCSPLGKMRLLYLMAFLARNIQANEIRDEIGNRWKLLVNSYPPACQKYFDKKWTKLNLNTKIRAKISAVRCLTVEGKTYRLPKNPLLLWLLRKTMETKQLSVESIVQSYWQSDFNESYFFRLKTATLRFNRELQIALKGENIFQLTKQHLELNPHIEVEFF